MEMDYRFYRFSSEMASLPDSFGENEVNVDDFDPVTLRATLGRKSNGGLSLENQQWWDCPATMVKANYMVKVPSDASEWIDHPVYVGSKRYTVSSPPYGCHHLGNLTRIQGVRIRDDKGKQRTATLRRYAVYLLELKGATPEDLRDLRCKVDNLSNHLGIEQHGEAWHYQLSPRESVAAEGYYEPVEGKFLYRVASVGQLPWDKLTTFVMRAAAEPKNPRPKDEPDNDICQ